MLITNPSQLDQRITFNQKQTIKVNGVAQQRDVPVATIWAAVWKQKLSDRMASIGTETKIVTTFVFREKQDFAIKNDMTILWKERSYQIKDISPDTVNKEWKTIICEVIT
ncbi:phage head closure protein [Niallia sp. 03091]|uniref:phage head closure protein n=1 Tax=Niallia sp. 03091 TaxID=3458059 RepID=UPI00404424ED